MSGGIDNFTNELRMVLTIKEPKNVDKMSAIIFFIGKNDLYLQLYIKTSAYEDKSFHRQECKRLYGF